MSIDTKETLKDFSQNYDKVKDEFADMISFFRQYPDYFLDYIRAENALFELTPFQRVYLRAFFRYKKVGIIASRGVSKCVVGDTLISTDDGLVKIGDLANWEKEESEVVSFNKVMNINGEMEMSDIIVNNGYKDTKKIRTRYGYELEGTKVHPVIAMDEYGNMEFKTLEELEEGDRVAINRKGSFGNNTRLHFDKYDFYEGMTNQRMSRIKESPVPNKLTDDFAYYIGSLVGDGTMTLKDMWIFSSADKESVDFFEKFNRETFGLETKHYVHGNSRYDYKVHSVYVREYLRQIGLGYEKANEKTVPPAIMSAPKSIVASFLSGLFDTDGTVVKNAVQFSTSSEEMSKQVQQLLLQFGIIANRTKYYNERFKTYSYKLHISSINIDLFKQEIGFRLTRKKERLDKLCEKKRNVNCDTIPYQKDRINRIVENSPQFTGKVKGGLGHVRKGDNELTYNRLETLLKQNIIYDEDYAMLLGYYEDNFYWDSVEVIEDSKNYVYDFHVPETHTFIGNGFVNHNTYINILAHYIKCILYPNLHIGVIMPTKIQSAKISEEKIQEIWRYYPLLKNEIKKYKVTRDYVQFEFKGGSTLDTVASGESSRGLRAQGLSFEEIVDERMDRTTINEVLLPLLAQGRRTPHGVDTKNEQQKTQAWVTTAGTKQSFSYEKFQGLYDEMIDGKSTIVLGTSYEMGTKFGTLDINDIVDKLNDPSYSPLSFDREYRSLFTGSSERSLVSMDDINEIRVLENPEYKATAKDKKDPKVSYVLSYDVSRSKNPLEHLLEIA